MILEKKIKNLIKILEESKIDQLEVTTFWGKERISVKKNQTSYSNEYISAPIKESIPIKEIENKTLAKENIDNNTSKSISENENNEIYIKAPLVGTFYKSPKPTDPPFINIGDEIKKGQVICIIEAMKIFNEIEADISGKVIKILIDDGTPVEYDQNLILVEPQ